MSSTACQCVWTADYREIVLPDPGCTYPGHATGAVATLDIPAGV